MIEMFGDHHKVLRVRFDSWLVSKTLTCRVREVSPSNCLLPLYPPSPALCPVGPLSIYREKKY